MVLKLIIQDDKNDNYWIDLSDNHFTLVMKNKKVTGVISECGLGEGTKSYAFIGKAIVWYCLFG